MNNLLECQAIMNLLYLCDQDIPILRSKHNKSQQRVLSEHLRPVKCNSVITNHRDNFKIKLKTEAQVSTQKSVNSTQNKQNLKKILQKLNDSPNSSPRKTFQRKNIHIKSQSSEPHSLSKLSKQFRKTSDIIERNLYKVKHAAKQKDLIKLLIENKSMQNTKKKSLIKTAKNVKNDSHKIATLREIQGLKKTKMAFNNEKKQSISIFNLLNYQHNINTLINGRNTQVNLNHLLF